MQLFKQLPHLLRTGVQAVQVDGARADSYSPDGSLAYPFKTIQAAVDSITDASPTKPYVVDIAPGVYVENVVSKRHIKLVGASSFGLSKAVQIKPASGVGVKIPYRDSFLFGVYVETAGTTAVEAAVHVYDDGLGWGAGETFLVNVQMVSTTVARALWIAPNAFFDAAILIYAGLDGGVGGDAAYIDGAGLIWFLGGGGAFSERGLHLVNGSFALLGASVNCNASPSSPTAWAIEADASFVMIADAMLSATNGIKASNGSFCILYDAKCFGGFAGVPIDIDAGSLLAIGNVSLDNIGSGAWVNWNVLGTAILMSTGNYGSGTTAGPDQRPTGVPIGYQFFALDLAPGGAPGVGSLLVWNGANWVDSTGALIP